MRTTARAGPRGLPAAAGGAGAFAGGPAGSELRSASSAANGLAPGRVGGFAPVTVRAVDAARSGSSPAAGDDPDRAVDPAGRDVPFVVPFGVPLVISLVDPLVMTRRA